MILLPEQSSDKLADWVELLLLTQERMVSKSSLINQVELALGDADEAEVDGAFAELERRAGLYGPKALFTVTSRIARRKTVGATWRRYPEQALCLIYSIQGVTASADPGTKLFERIAGRALGQYLGGPYMVLGHPAGMSFKAQLAALAAQCLEEIGRDPYRSAKDEGVDVVGWMPFGDGRNAHAIVLLQCAAGKHWASKQNIRQDFWRKMILWGNRTIPGIAIPQTVGTSDWPRKTEVYDLVFDRPRLYGLLAKVKVQDKALRSDIVKWCKPYLT